MKSIIILVSIIFTATTIFAQTQIGNDIESSTIEDYFGTAVAISDDGNTVIVRAPFKWNNSNTNLLFKSCCLTSLKTLLDNY